MVLTLTVRGIFDQHNGQGIPLMALFQVWTQISAIRGRQKSSWRRYLGESLQTSELMFIWNLKMYKLIFFLTMSVFRCSHCLPDCESTIYTSSVSATPLRRCSSWWWWWWKSPTPAWCPLCLSKSWPSLTLLTIIMITSLGILSIGPGVTQRTLVWLCSASLTAMFLFLLSGRIRWKKPCVFAIFRKKYIRAFLVSSRCL